MVVFGANVAAMSAAKQPNVIKVDEHNHYHEEWTPPFDYRGGIRIKTTEKFSDFYELHEEIGEGKFGKVYRCVEKATKLVLAAKCIRLKRDADIEKVEKEVSIMTQIRHKCIAQIYDAFATSTNDVILIMEIVEGGELFDRVVDENYILTEMAVAMIVYQICEAIRYIHSQNIIHLDLKPENIMCVSQTGNQVKLIDFGLAQYFDGQSDLLFMAGTPEFAAPEVIKYEPLDFHTDMWSVGVITYILLSGQSPFLGENIAHTYCNVERGQWEFCEEFKENCISMEAQDFISHLLIMEKHKRMLPEDCLQHPWLMNCLKKSRNNANKINHEKPLDVVKLRNYVRNKRFRRLVFGVLFINTIVRMMSTLQERKSEHGIEYVKNMLNAAKPDDSNNNNLANPLMKLFSKRKHNLQTITKASTSHLSDTQLGSSNHNNSSVEVKSKLYTNEKTVSGEEMPKSAKRVNKRADSPKNAVTFTPAANSEGATAESVSSSKHNDEKDGSQRSVSKKREIIEKKSKRVKSATRKASSTEQAPKKRTKTTAINGETQRENHLDSSAKIALHQKPELTIHSSTSKLKDLFEEKSAALSSLNFKQIVAGTSTSTKTESIEKPKISASTKIVITAASNNDSGKSSQISKKKVIKKIHKSSPKSETIKESEERLKILSAIKVTYREAKDANSGVSDEKLKNKSEHKIATTSKKTDAIKCVDSLSNRRSPIPMEQRLSPTPKTLFGVELKPTLPKSSSATNITDTYNRTKWSTSPSPILDNDNPENGRCSSKIESFLKKLEQNDTKGGLTMAISGFIPTKQRCGSTEDLSTPLKTAEADKSTRKANVYSRSRNKTTTVSLRVNEKNENHVTLQLPNGSLKNNLHQSITKQVKTALIDDTMIDTTKRKMMPQQGSSLSATNNLDKPSPEKFTPREKFTTLQQKAQHERKIDDVNQMKLKSKTKLKIIKSKSSFSSTDSKSENVSELQNNSSIININGGESLKIHRKLAQQSKAKDKPKKLVKKSSVEKKRVSTNSLNDLTNNANNEDFKNASSNYELLNEALEWAARSKRCSLTMLTRKEQEKEVQKHKQLNQQLPKSLNNISSHVSTAKISALGAEISKHH